MRKDVIKSLIAIKQSEIPFDVIERDIKLPINRNKIITVPGVRRCGKSTLMEIAINGLVREGVSPRNILWLGFDDERLKNMSSDDLDDVIVSYMEMFPDIPIKDVYMFFDEIQLIKDWEYFVLRVYNLIVRTFYVCGSNATMLSTELSSALRGYPLEYETYPLSFNEYCRFKGIATNSYLEQDRARLKMAFEAYNQASAFPRNRIDVIPVGAVETASRLFRHDDIEGLGRTLQDIQYGCGTVFRQACHGQSHQATSINAIYKDIKSQGLKSVRMTCIFGLIYL